jgi:hypothetical protein
MHLDLITGRTSGMINVLRNAPFWPEEEKDDLMMFNQSSFRIGKG